MYILSKFVIALISPLGAALFLSGSALLLGWFRFRRLAWMVGVFAFCWLGVWSLPVASNGLRGSLEDQYPAVPLDALPAADAIVVLGGGVTPPPVGAVVPNLEAGADRVWFGAQLFLAGKAPLVVLSGGGDTEYSAFAEAESMALFMGALGVERDALLLESASRNTSQNAAFTAALLAERGVNQILLVTSALHMARAVARFEDEGLMVSPAPTDHEVLHRSGWLRWLPDTGALDGSARVMKEWVGRWVGR